MDDHEHIYTLDMHALMAEVQRRLARRGYRITQVRSGMWRVQTCWSRGAAYGEIGSLIYSLLARKLVDEEDAGTAAESGHLPAEE